MNKPKVYVLTAVHNHLDFTKKFLKSLDKQDHRNINITIVDDGSSDGTYEFIKKNYSKVRLIKGDGNLWWTGSLYKGIRDIVKRSSKNDYILTINNDCTFDKDYISSLVRTSLKVENSVVGSCVVDQNTGKVWDAGVYVKWNPLTFYSNLKRADKELNNKNVTFRSGFDTLSSKGTLFPVSLIDKVGNFDRKNLPHYMSDYEFFYRANKNSYSLVVDYEARVFNDVARTGTGGEKIKKLSFKEYWNLMFSIKSKLNVRDQYNFVRLHSPLKYKPLNYLLISAKMVHYLLHVYPFTFIPKIIFFLKKR